MPGPAPLEVVLTRRARVAGAAGDCRSVLRLAAKVESIAPDYYEGAFVDDDAIAPCLRAAR